MTAGPRQADPGRAGAATGLRLEVVVWRGPIAESRHRLQAVVTRADGGRVAATDDPTLGTSFRSAAKPFQLLPLVERGHAERWGLSDDELALMAASHSGTDEHVALARGILERIGLDERALACGFHEPFDAPTAERLRARGDRSPLSNNCSGKHAGMLCLALSEGWPTAGYEAAAHPVQQLLRRTVAEVCGVTPESVAVAVDGCNACVFGLPLDAMALGYARFASARAAGDARERALARIRGAMLAHPRLTAGPGRLDTDLMEAAGGRLVAKGGAEGLQCLGLPESGLGVAIKCEDGQARGLGPATLALLAHLGEPRMGDPARLERLRRPVLTNHAGVEVGTLEAVLESSGAEVRVRLDEGVLKQPSR